MLLYITLAATLLVSHCWARPAAAADELVTEYELVPLPGYKLDDKKLGAIVEALSKRVKRLGAEVAVSSAKDNRVRLSHPTDARKLESAVKMIAASGAVEFAVAAHATAHAELIALARKSDEPLVRDEKGNVVARWVEIDSQRINADVEEDEKEPGRLMLRRRKDAAPEALLVAGDAQLSPAPVRTASSNSPKSTSRRKRPTRGTD
jgi:hypothetical protein